MNLLGIVSICPVPGIHHDNDVILNLYAQLKERHSDFAVKVLRPTVYCNRFMAAQKATWKKFYRIRKNGRFRVRGIEVQPVAIPFVGQLSLPYHFLNRLIWACNRRRIKSFCDGFEYDLIHANYICTDGILARDMSKATGKPYVVTAQREVTRFRNSVERFVSASVLRSASAVVTVNALARDNIRLLTGIEAKLVPYGIDDYFLRDRRPRRKRHVGTLRLITVCRLLRLKNIDIVLKAVRRLRDKGNAVTLEIVGDGQERQNLENMSRQLNLEESVCFKGVQDRVAVRAMMEDSDVFIMPSDPETFGLVYAEAMATGLPIICAERNGFCGHFRESEHGYLVPSRNVEAIVKILSELLSRPDRLSRISEAAAVHALNFSWDSCCEAYRSLLLDVELGSRTNSS